MASAAEIARQRAQFEASANTLRQRASASPLQSSGGGGFQPSAAPRFTVRADPTFDAASTGSSGVLHTEDQERAIRQKAASGQVITQEDL